MKYFYFTYLDDIIVPPEDSEDHFVYHKNNGLVYESSKYVSDEITSYETAGEFCAKKNGILAIPDSLEKARAIRNLITKHVQLYNYQQPNYLLGKHNISHPIKRLEFDYNMSLQD